MNGWKDRAAFIWRRLKRIKTWHLVLVLIVLLISSVLFLRWNNVRMVELRDQVLVADTSGDSRAIEQAATKLRDFVRQHMNTDTGQIALQSSYNRAVQAAFRQANNDIDSSKYQIATEQCKSVLAVSGYQGYAACVADVVGANGANFKTPELPNPALFYLSFAAPILSFDVAGVFVILTFVVFFAIFIKLLTEVIIYFTLYRRQ